MLTKDQIISIYGNVRDILKFQSTFMRELDDCPPENIGELFVKFV